MSGTGSDNGWLEAAIAWEVCASLHRQYRKGKDALFTTRQSDFVKHAENARVRASHGQAPAQPVDFTTLGAAMRAIRQSIQMIGDPEDECMRAVKRVLRGAVIIVEDSGDEVAAPAQPAAQQGAAYAELPMQFACSGVFPVYSADQMREFLERVLSAMEGVIDVADRKTNEFDALRSCIVDLTLMLFKPDAALRTQQPAPAGATLPDGWVPLTITHEGQYPEEVAYGPQIMMDRLGKWLGKYFAQAAQADSVLEDAARWEFRWLNPANNLHVAPSDLGWKTVNSKGMRSEKEVLEDLQAYRYQGKPVYEVRPLLATRALEKPEIRCPVRLANGGDCPRHNLQCGWPDCNKETK